MSVEGMKAKLARISKGARPWNVFTADRVNGWLDVIEHILYSRHLSASNGLYLNGGRISLKTPDPDDESSSEDLPWNVTDQSAGANGIISVGQGTVTDETNSGKVWGSTPNNIYIDDPVHGSVPFNIPVGGRAPQLQLNSAATVAYLNSTIDATTGYITAMQILGDAGAGMPASDDANWNQLIANLSVTITAGVARVNIPQPQSLTATLYFSICASTPLADGTGYRVNT